MVITSVELTPDNKAAISTALSPFVLCDRDIYGAQDLEGLLSRFPAIERSHFKLWLTSTSVIERVLHNAELCRTDFQVDRIRGKLPVFVQSAAFPRAMRMLDRKRIVIISGVPGIGKTTLAEMLLYSHLEQGYEPVVIRAEIAEGQKFFRPDAKRIYYYDDFLGQIFLRDRPEYLGRNQDVALVEFMDMVLRSAHGRFILTTREHILSSALQASERLAQSAALKHRCVLELRDYSFGHRARILYNHLYFSQLGRAHKKAILERDFFLKIIKHEHFNPRLIEWVATEARTREVPPRKYRGYITRLLQAPHEIWNHAFRNQISDAARHILFAAYTLGDSVDVVDLEPVFNALHRYRAARYHRPIAPGDFNAALHEMDGAFLVYRAGRAGWLNPSIREFVASVMLADRDTGEDLIASAIRFKQLANLWALSESAQESTLRLVITERSGLLRQAIGRDLSGPSIRWEKTPSGACSTYIDMEVEHRVAFAVKAAESLQSTDLVDAGIAAAEHLVVGWEDTDPDFGAVLRLLEEIDESAWVLAHGGTEVYCRIIAALLNHLRCARAADWLALFRSTDRSNQWSDANRSRLKEAFHRYRVHGVYSDTRRSIADNEMNELIASLSELGRRFDVNFRYEIEQLNEAIANQEETRIPLSSSAKASEGGQEPDSQIVNDEDVRQMFGTLIDDE